MFKKGFTLQEVLITLGIVGIVAAMTAPALVKIVPDQNKARYIKTYSTLTDLTQQMLNDPALYWITYRNDGTAACEGLRCTGVPVPGSVPDSIAGNIPNPPSVEQKYAGILASYMHLQQPYDPQSDPLNFVTNDGIVWAFSPQTDSRNRDVIEVDITIPGNGNRVNGFFVADDGSITAQDNQGIAFLRNPTDLHSKKLDNEFIAQLEQNPTSFAPVYTYEQLNQLRAYDAKNENADECKGLICRGGEAGSLATPAVDPSKYYNKNAD